MNLKLYKINDRYAFSIENFSSVDHCILCPDIKPTYKYAWQAYKDAHWLYKTQSIHISTLQKSAADDLEVTDISSSQEVSAEQMIIGHYSKIFDAIINRSKSFKDEKEKETVYKEIKAIVGGLLKVKESLENDKDKKDIDSILDDFRDLVKDTFSTFLAKDKSEMESNKSQEVPPIPTDDQSQEVPSEQLPITPMAQVDAIMRYGSNGSNNLNDIRDEVIDEYAERLCKHMEKNHPDAICKIDYENGVLRMVSKDENILKVSINSDLNIQDVEPCGELSKMFPLHSLHFYQKYWKPIVEKIGHCLPRDLGIIICPEKSTLPDIPNSFPTSVRVMGWSVKDKQEKPIEVYFGGDEPTWVLRHLKFIKDAAKVIKPSKYTEEDFITNQPRSVKCIDPKLKSIYGKIGEVVQVIPLEEHIELDINFGRLVVRLTEQQIELIDAVPTNK